MASKSKIRSMDTVFSKYIRLRDSIDYSSGAYFVCCSCGQMKPYAMADAGHFINRRWMSLRWREDNVHAQCSACNRFDEGNSVGYTLFMIDKYGKTHVELLMALKNQPQKWTDFDLDIMIKEYRDKFKALTKQRSGARI